MFLLDRIMYEQTQIVSEFEQIVNQLDFLLNSFNKDYKDLPQFFGINIWNIQNDLPRIKNIIQAEEPRIDVVDLFIYAEDALVLVFKYRTQVYEVRKNLF